jgi:hypothetical protein
LGCEKELVMSETLKVTSFDHTTTTKVAVLGNYRQMRGKSSVRAGNFFCRRLFASSSPFRDVSIHRLTGRFTSIKIPCSTKEEEDGAFAMTAAMHAVAAKALGVILGAPEKAIYMRG